MASGQEASSEANADNADAMAGPMQMISKAWSESLHELHVEVSWGEGTSQRSLDVATHLLANDMNAKIQGIVGGLGAKQ